MALKRRRSRSCTSREAAELDGRFDAAGRPRASGGPCSRRRSRRTSVTSPAAASPPHLRATSLPRRSSCRSARGFDTRCSDSLVAAPALFRTICGAAIAYGLTSGRPNADEISVTPSRLSSRRTLRKTLRTFGSCHSRQEHGIRRTREEAGDIQATYYAGRRHQTARRCRTAIDSAGRGSQSVCRRPSMEHSEKGI
jgi:hypothetical protein